MEFLKKVRAVLQIPFTVMAESKKATALVVGLLVVLGGKIGLDFSEADVGYVVALIGSYVIGQGVADAGKEKAKVEAVASLERMRALEGLGE